ncbi:hypothetical protein [Virgibacillus sp. Bac332]|uniref:hypothetical protein n=1 Tax=Virgibacillus sp. Bac332 TaxID=2419842 RepID=UPI000EF55ABC|nr:hypothetical protein [Virgibacillus sp. Bac332]
MVLGTKKVMSIDELNAYRQAYGTPFMKKEIFTALVVPFVISFLAVYILFYYWWLALIAGLTGGVYGYTVLIKISVQRNYNQQAIIQRNRFINNMTQLLTNPKETIVSSLKWCSQDIIATGEFKEDIDKLLADLMDAGPKKAQNAFESLGEKYKKDFVFNLFIDNLLTAFFEGRTDINKLKELKSWHNDVLEQTNLFVKNKERYKLDIRKMHIYPLIVILFLTFAMGFDSYLLYYAHNPIGWISSIIMISVLSFQFHKFQKRLADDEVMEVTMWNKK